MVLLYPFPAVDSKPNTIPPQKKQHQKKESSLFSASLPPYSLAGKTKPHPQPVDITACRVDIGSYRLFMERSIPYDIDKGRARSVLSKKKMKLLGGLQ
jgi:hypothetical protein